MIKILSTTASPFVSTYKVSDIYILHLSLSYAHYYSSTCLHDSFCKMLPIYGVIALSLSFLSLLVLSPLNPSLVPYSPFLLSLSSPSLLTRFNNISNGVTGLTVNIPHNLINFSLNHIRCLTLWTNNSILTVIK